jgi:cytochrome d ubiquinol oxidase subunit I
MENPDLLLLARAQFGLNIGFHILFPSLTIALGWVLLFFRIQYARTNDAAWLATYKLWTKVFALPCRRAGCYGHMRASHLAS